MRAIVIRAHGDPEALELRDTATPLPGPGEVQVRLHAAALNHLDIWVRRGIPGVRFPLPLVPGCDGAGVVSATGPGVRDIAVGTRVALQPGVSCGSCRECLRGQDQLCRHYGILGENRDGTLAQYVCVPRANLMPIAASLDFERAAAFPLTFLTAWHMVFDRARLQAGEHVLVHAGASGVGHAAVQMAQLVGARVIATVGDAAKADLLRQLGVEDIVLYREQDFASEVRRITGKRGVDVILDHVGADTWEGNIKSLAKGGRLVLCGSTSGHQVPTNLRFLFFKNLSFLGSTMGSKAELLQLLPLVETGKLVPHVHAVLPLAEVGRGHSMLEGREVTGKIVIRID